MHPISRRVVLRGALGAGFGWPPAALAQEKIPRLTRLVVGFPAGGATDAVCRRLASSLAGVVADAVIVENKPGAGGRIAIDAIRLGPTDGSQWLVTPGSMLVIYPHVYKTLSYEPLRDLLPVIQVANVPLGLAVGNRAPASVVDVKSFVAWMKESPASAIIGTPAAGNITHLLAFLFGKASGVQFQYVPYRGSAHAMQGLLGAELPAVMNPIAEMLPHAQAGRVRILGVTSPHRSMFVPQVPTFVEQGFPTVVGTEWFGMFAKPGTPDRQVQEMAMAVRAALRSGMVRDAFEQLALEPSDDMGPQLALRIKSELADWREPSRVFRFQLDD